MQKEFNAFTLIELLIVIIIIGILVALSLPQFSKTREHAIGKEATANLKLIAAAQKIYRMEVNAYYPISASTVTSLTDINNYLRLSLTERNWDYSVTSVGSPSSSFTAYGDRVDTALSPYRDCIYSLAHNDADGEPDPNNTTSCP